MIKFPVFQGKKKKRKREKLQESASGRPWPPLTCHSPQVYFRNQGLRYLIFTSFCLTLASDGCLRYFTWNVSLWTCTQPMSAFPYTFLSSSPDGINIFGWIYALLQTLSCFTFAFLLNPCCIIFRLNYGSNTLWYFWTLEALHRHFVVTVFYLTVFYISLYTNSCLVSWLKHQWGLLFVFKICIKKHPFFPNKKWLV